MYGFRFSYLERNRYQSIICECGDIENDLFRCEHESRRCSNGYWWFRRLYLFMDEQPGRLYVCSSESKCESNGYDYLYSDGDEFYMYCDQYGCGDSESKSECSTKC